MIVIFLSEATPSGGLFIVDLAILFLSTDRFTLLRACVRPSWLFCLDRLQAVFLWTAYRATPQQKGRHDAPFLTSH